MEINPALKLVLEAKRSSNELKAYNLQLKTKVLKTIKENYNLYQNSNLELIKEISILNIERAKRALFIYHNTRIETIKETIWSNTVIDKNLTSLEETNFTQQYWDLVDQMEAFFPSLDLTTELLPPKDVLIEVRVVKECGKIITEYGTLNLELGNQLYVKSKEVENLIKEGYLIEIK